MSISRRAGVNTTTRKVDAAELCLKVYVSQLEQ